MITTIYKRVWAVLMKKPLKLWGISLLAGFLATVLTGLCGFAIPALGLAVSLLLSTSMTMVYLHGYRGEDVQVLQLFDCFKDWNTIKRVVLGLAWMLLWVFLWSLIPIAGPFIAMVRVYEYRLTPYILITEPDVPLTEAIKVSSQRTYGYKLKMFGAEVLLMVIIWGIGFVLGLLAVIPVLGVLLLIVGMLAIAVLSPLFLGLMQAAFYEEISHPTIPQNPYQAYGQAPAQPYGQAPYQAAAPQQYQAPVATAPVQAAAGFCSNCGTPYPTADTLFCTACGKPRG